MYRRLIFFAAISVFVLSPAARAQSASFEIAQHGHQVGTAAYKLVSTPHGFTSTSLVRVAMQGLNYALSKDEKLSPANHLRRVSLSATVNGSAVTAVCKPDADKLLLNISANGRSTATQLPEHSGAVFLPDFDPGALETLLALAIEQNSRNLWVIIPKEKGSVVPVELATYADMQGTLQGKTVTVHHLVATIAGAKTELFYDSANQLLQAELPQAGFALVRRGFVLQPPAHAPAPPPHTQAAPAQTPAAG